MPEGERGRKPFSNRLRTSKLGHSSSSSSLSSSLSSPETSRNRPSLSEHRIPRRSAPQSCEPTHKPSPKDISAQIFVYSNKDEKRTEITATFVNGLKENWISNNLLSHLDLRGALFSKGKKEYGHLGPKTILFLGSIKFNWKEKDSSKIQFTEFRIFRPFSEAFKLLLRQDLMSCASLSPQTKPQSPEEVVRSPEVVPPDELSISIPSHSQSIGCFDGLTTVLEEESPESRKADEWMGFLRTSIHKHIEKPDDYVRDSPAVRIAVLDTGIDKKHPFIRGALQSGSIVVAKSFVGGDESVNDTFGHGTYVTSLLLEVAPDAKLYVAKIATGEDVPADHNISGAIKWAIAQKVDIITMSFGLSKDQPEIKAAVLAAHLENILMFAAASNNGGNFPVTYPAKYGEVICIFSTDGFGKNSDYNPTQMDNAGYHFATIGEGVKSAWPVHLQDGSKPERRMTGTSFATPVAAGVAACLLEFALMKQMREDFYKRLRHQQRMQDVLAKELAIPAYGLHYIHPWNLFKADRPEKRILSFIERHLEG